VKKLPEITARVKITPKQAEEIARLLLKAVKIAKDKLITIRICEFDIQIEIETENIQIL